MKEISPHDCRLAMTISVFVKALHFSETLKLYVFIGITVLCWGYSPIGVHRALDSYSPQHIALLRFLIASLFLFLLVLKKGIQPVRWKDLPRFGILGLFSVTMHHLLINIGQQYVTAVASSILSQSIPLFTVLISAFLLKEQIRVVQWICMVLGFCGAILVISGDHGFSLPNAHSLLILCAAIAWGIYFNLYKRFALEYDTVSMMCYVIWLGTLPLLCYSPHLYTSVLHAPWQANLSIVLLGLFPSALAYLLWAEVLQNMPLTLASNFLYVTPIVAISLAMLFLGERPSWMVLFGGMMIVASIVWMNKSRL